LEFYFAIFESEQGIVAADAYVLSRMNVGSSLTVEDVASQYKLTVSAFCAQTLGLRVTAVLCGTNTFFMSKELHAKFKHCCTPPKDLPRSSPHSPVPAVSDAAAAPAKTAALFPFAGWGG